MMVPAKMPPTAARAAPDDPPSEQAMIAAMPAEWRTAPSLGRTTLDFNKMWMGKPGYNPR